jgi:hypothetical protein
MSILPRKNCSERNLTLPGEWLSILKYQRGILQTELDTSRGVVKHPIQNKIVREMCSERNLTLPGEWLSILKYQRGILSNGT